MEPLFDHITLARGDTLTQGYEWYTELPAGGTAAVDLTGWAAVWQFLTAGGTAVLTASTGNGKLAALGADGRVVPAGIGLAAPDTDLPAGRYRMVLRLTDPAGRVTTLVDGVFEVE